MFIFAGRFSVMGLKSYLKTIMNMLPYVKGLYRQQLWYQKNSCYPPGHFYSTIPDIAELKKREPQIWKDTGSNRIPGINLHADEQLHLALALGRYYNEMPFTPEKKEGLRYYFENDLYSYTDGITLYGMLRYLQPKNIIEAGSGFSSALMLDTNERFFGNEIKFTFIEPYPARLYSLINEKDKANTTILEKNIQDVPVEYFQKLEAGDILFVDSSHVVKTGSDVHYILFEILPALKPGVYIHFHDIFYPFEYPKEWVYKGRNWNEDYFVKAFLMYNGSFRIKYFAHYLHTHHKDVFKDMPLCYKNTGGNLWIEKLSE